MAARGGKRRWPAARGALLAGAVSIALGGCRSKRNHVEQTSRPPPSSAPPLADHCWQHALAWPRVPDRELTKDGSRITVWVSDGVSDPRASRPCLGASTENASLFVGVVSQLGREEASAFAERRVAPALAAISGVRRVVLSAGSVEALLIELDPTEVRERGVDRAAVVAALTPAGDLPSGRIVPGPREITVRVEGNEASDTAVLGNLEVTARAGGAVPLGSLATFERTAIEVEDDAGAPGGAPRVLLAVERDASADAAEVERGVREKLAALQATGTATFELGAASKRMEPIR